VKVGQRKRVVNSAPVLVTVNGVKQFAVTGGEKEPPCTLRDVTDVNFRRFVAMVIRNHVMRMINLTL
jgi:hypothetical protein